MLENPHFSLEGLIVAGSDYTDAVKEEQCPDVPVPQASNAKYPVDYNESMNTVLNQATWLQKLRCAW